MTDVLEDNNDGSFELRVPRYVDGDLVNYLNHVFDLRTMIHIPRYTKEYLEGVQAVLDTINRLKE